jgi:hypothetical protein
MQAGSEKQVNISAHLVQQVLTTLCHISFLGILYVILCLCRSACGDTMYIRFMQLEEQLHNVHDDKPGNAVYLLRTLRLAYNYHIIIIIS